MSLIPLVAKTATREELLALLDEHDKLLRKALAEKAELVEALKSVMAEAELDDEYYMEYEPYCYGILAKARAVLAKLEDKNGFNTI